MANIASQVKRNKQNEKARRRNKMVRTNLKTHQRTFEKAIAAGDRAEAEQQYQTTGRKLDKAAQKGVVHRNYAANKKSKMAKALARL